MIVWHDFYTMSKTKHGNTIYIPFMTLGSHCWAPKSVSIRGQRYDIVLGCRHSVTELLSVASRVEGTKGRQGWRSTTQWRHISWTSFLCWLIFIYGNFESQNREEKWGVIMRGEIKHESVNLAFGDYKVKQNNGRYCTTLIFFYFSLNGSCRHTFWK